MLTQTNKKIKDINKKSIENNLSIFCFGADNRSRTGDLILTKDALYRLSYISVLNKQKLLYIHKPSLSRVYFYLPLLLPILTQRVKTCIIQV